MSFDLSPAAMRLVLDGLGYKGEPVSLGAALHRAGLPAAASGRLLAELGGSGLVEVVRGGGVVMLCLTPTGATFALATRNARALAQRGAA